MCSVLHLCIHMFDHPRATAGGERRWNAYADHAAAPMWGAGPKRHLTHSSVGVLGSMHANQPGAAVKANMRNTVMQFQADMSYRIREEKRMEQAKRLMAHLRYVHLGLKTR